MRKIAHEESAEQQTLIQWVDLQAKTRPELALLFHIPNGQKLAGTPVQRSITAKRLIREGMRPGVPDMFLPVPSKPFNGLFIELKRKVGGVVSSAQQEWIDSLQAQGYRAVVCNGFDEARETIIEYLDMGDAS